MALEVVAAVVGTLGLYMLGLAARRRALAEAWIGMFFLATAVGAVPAIHAVDSTTDHALAVQLLFIGIPPLLVATVSGYAFTYTVFRRGEAWALAIVAAGSLLAAWGAWYQLSGPSGAADTTGLSLQFLIGRVACFAWGTYEALRAYAMAKRRLELGLADPVVVNRFLLFGVWFGLMGVLPVTLALTRLYGGPGAQALVQGPGSKLVGLVMIVALVLTFFPPRAYLSWVSGAAREPGT